MYDIISDPATSIKIKIMREQNQWKKYPNKQRRNVMVMISLAYKNIPQH